MAQDCLHTEHLDFEAAGTSLFVLEATDDSREFAKEKSYVSLLSLVGLVASRLTQVVGVNLFEDRANLGYLLAPQWAQAIICDPKNFRA